MKNTTFKLSPLAKACAISAAVTLATQALAQEENKIDEPEVEKNWPCY